MRRVRTAALLACMAAPVPAAADGPALADLTIDGRTLTLTAENEPFRPAMIRRSGDVLNIRFAQLHLGFPMPPFLDLTLRGEGEDLRLTGLTLARTSTSPALVFDPAAARITARTGTGQDLRVTLEAEALQSAATGPRPVSVRIEIALSSP